MESKNPASKNYAHWMESVHELCVKHLEEIRERMGKYYDHSNKEAPPIAKSYIFTVCYHIFSRFRCNTCAFVPTGTPRELTGTPGAYVLYRSQPLLCETHYYLLISHRKPFNSDDHGHTSCSFCQITKKLFAFNFARRVTP